MNSRFLELFDLGCRAGEQGDQIAAQEYFDKAAKEDPLTWAAIGSRSLGAGDRQTALDHFTAAYEAATDPKIKALCLNDIGMIISAYDRASAEECFRKGIEFDGKCSELWGNLALCMKWKGQLDEAMKYCDTAIRLNPRASSYYFTKSMVHLLQGRFSQGFSLYESRWTNPAAKIKKLDIGIPELPSLPHAMGKRILIYGEQGAGDTIMMARYGPKFGNGAKLWLSAQKGLRNLLMRQGCWQDVIEDAKVPEGIEYIFPAMSLPRLFSTNLGTIPPAPYLKVEPQEQQCRLPHRLSVGLCWAGSPDHNDDRLRSIPLEAFDSLFDLPNVRWFNCQYGARGIEAEFLRPDGEDPLFKWRPIAGSYYETGQYLSELDLLISVDTSIAHLAGALGLPCWLLLPFAPDWRWMVGREDSPWYPSLRLFRQPKIGDWESVIEKVKGELCKRK